MTGRSAKRFRILALGALLLAAGQVASAWAQPARKVVELPPVQSQPRENVQLLANPGFETPDAGWGLYEWPPREKTSDQLTGKFVYYSRDVVHSGQYALCFDFSQLTPERLLAARQNVKPETLQPYEGRTIRSSAWIWVARGPAYYQGSFGTRQWGEPGTPPLDFHLLPLGGAQGEWIRCTQEFQLKLGTTRNLDYNIWLPNVPDTTKAPVVYVDDASLEVLADPPLAARLLCGKVVSRPDDSLPVLVTVAGKAWDSGLRFLQWDLTSADGRRSYASGQRELRDCEMVLEAALPNLAPGDFALRLALGAKPGARTHEVLLPIKRAEGPFGQ